MNLLSIGDDNLSRVTHWNKHVSRRAFATRRRRHHVRHRQSLAVTFLAAAAATIPAATASAAACISTAAASGTAVASVIAMRCHGSGDDPGEREEKMKRGREDDDGVKRDERGLEPEAIFRHFVTPVYVVLEINNRHRERVRIANRRGGHGQLVG